MYAANVNSYKRFVPDMWGPNTLNTWGYDNRSAAYRIVGKGESIRVEVRFPGADANPYWIISAAIMAGLKGIEDQI